MQALAEEWRRRDREREALVKKKVHISHFLTQMHTTRTRYITYCKISCSYKHSNMNLMTINNIIQIMNANIYSRLSPNLCVFVGGGV